MPNARTAAATTRARKAPAAKTPAKTAGTAESAAAGTRRRTARTGAAAPADLTDLTGADRVDLADQDADDEDLTDGYDPDEDDDEDDEDEDGEGWDEEDGAVDIAPELVFTTPKKDRSGDAAERIPFELDGEVFYTVKPTDEAMVYLTTASARGVAMGDRFNAIIQFCHNSLDEESSDRIAGRFLDREDDFDFDDLLRLMKEIAKLWGRRKGGGGQRRARARRTARRGARRR